MDKQALRKEIREKKRAMTEQQIVTASEKLGELFLASEAYKQAQTIYGYLPYNQEVRTVPMLQQALLARSGIKAASKAAQEVATLRNGQELSAAIACLKKADLYLQGNVSPAAVCGWLTWSLR